MGTEASKEPSKRYNTYVVDGDYTIVHLDEETKRIYPRAEIGATCHESMRNSPLPCSDCPLQSHQHAERSAQYNAYLGTWFEVAYLNVNWFDHGPCTMFSCRPLDSDEVDDASASSKPAEGNQGKNRTILADERHIRHLMETDHLTGLFNATAFYEKAAEMITDPQAPAYELVYLDVENFKIYNEWYGREAGDAMLRTIAEHLAALSQRFNGVAGYFGGDNFVILIPAGTTTEKRINRQMQQDPFDSDDMIGFRPSVGVCIIDDTSTPIGTICDHALIALNSVKGDYEKRVAWYNSGMAEKLESEAKTLREITQALKNREFVLYFQPQCSTHTGRIIGLEALVRWNHPQRGIVAPGEFIPVLERHGFIANLDLYVWDEVCSHLRSWIDRGNRPVPVSVNISRADLYAVDVPETFIDLTSRYNLDRSLIELEITESAYVEDVKMIETVNALKLLGFTVLMDDFGSGYSSLNMLKEINVDILKLDMRFMNQSGDSRRSENILEAIVSMARLMDLHIIAEGTETKEQVEFLKTIGCDYAQGYYFYRPMDAEHIEELILTEGVVDFRGIMAPEINLIDMDRLLQENEVRRTIVDNLIGGMAVYAVYDDHYELLQVNSGYYRVTGCNPVDLRERQKTISQQVYPEDLQIALDLFTEAEQHPVSGSEGVIRRYSLAGELVWIRFRVFFLRREQDRSIFFASLEDVSEQKKQERELLASQLALNDALGLPHDANMLDGTTAENRQLAAQVILQSVPGGLIGGYCEQGFPVFFANEAMAQMAGYDSSSEFIEAIDGKIKNTIHPDDLAQVEKDMGQNFYEGLEYNTKYRMKCKDGSWLWVSDYGRIVETKDHRLAVASVCLDISETVNMEQELYLEDRMLRSIVKQAKLNIWIYNVEQDTFAFQNLSTDNLALLFSEEQTNQTEQLPDDVVHLLKRFAKEARWGRSFTRKVKALSNDGDPVNLQVSCEAIRDANGDPVRVIGCLKTLDDAN